MITEDLLTPANEVCKGYVFTSVCQSFCSQGVVSQHALWVISQHASQVSGGMVSEHALQVSRPTPKGEVEESGLGGGYPGPHPGGSQCPHSGGVSRLTPEGVSQHALRQTPAHSRWLLLWAVCIILECILVQTCSFGHP